MVRFLPFALELVLLVFCLVDCIQTDQSEVRNLGKGWWILLIIFFPLVGGIAWLAAGRPRRGGQQRSVPWPSTQTAGFPEYERPRPVAPDDDPEFLEQMRRGNAEQEAPRAVGGRPATSRGAAAGRGREPAGAAAGLTARD